MSERMTKQQETQKAIDGLAMKLKSEFNTKHPDEEAAFDSLNEHLLNPADVGRAIAQEAFFIIQKEETTKALSPQGGAMRRVLDVTNNGARIGMAPVEPSWAKVFENPLENNHNTANRRYLGTNEAEDARWRGLCTLGVIVIANLRSKEDAEVISMINDTLRERPEEPAMPREKVAA